ncbi:MAG TPA: diaminopimelate epimerase [Lactobacillus sp.]|nr:diaminopimelate epimerase [Lactobacillus sp.]
MVKLTRVHGSENSFYLLDQRQLKQTLTTAELSRFAQQANDSAPAILGPVDGVLVVSKSNDDHAAGRMQVFNRDGSQASMCGNGLRTVSRYLAEQTHQTDFVVQTGAGDLPVHQVTAFAQNVPAFSVSIQPVSFDADALGLHQISALPMLNQTKMPFADSSSTAFSAVAVPNPHLISLTDHNHPNALSVDSLGNLGRKLNTMNPWFPDGVNVSFGWEINDTTLFVRTFERGVGFTNACGTGMSATSLIWVLTHSTSLYEQLLTIYNPGGMVQTCVHHQTDGDTIDLIGNATFTDHLYLNEADLHAGNLSDAEVTVTQEEVAYQKFVAQLPQWSFGETASPVTQTN